MIATSEQVVVRRVLRRKDLPIAMTASDETSAPGMNRALFSADRLTQRAEDRRSVFVARQPFHLISESGL